MAQEDYPVIGDQNSLMVAPGPGASMANNLQQILAQRRQQAQQELVNKLNQDKFGLESRNVDSEIATRADNAATNKVARDATASGIAQTVADKKAAQDRFKASSDYLTGTYFNSPEFAALPAEAKLAWQLAAKDPAQLEKAIAMKMTPQAKGDEYEPENWFDDVTKKTGQVIGPDGKPHQVKKGSPSHFITRPQETAPAGPQQRLQTVGVDSNNQEILSFGEKENGIPVLYKSDPNGAGLVVYKGPVMKPGGQTGPAMLPANEVTRMWGLRTGTPAHGGNPAVPGALPTTGREWLDPSSWIDGKELPPDPTGYSTWQNAAISSVSNLKNIPPNVLRALTDIIGSPAKTNSGYTAQEIVNSSKFKAAYPLTEPERNLLVQHLQSVGIH